MKKILTEQRLCELAGLGEADTPTKQKYRVGPGKYRTLEKGIEVSPSGPADMELDPDEVAAAPEEEVLSLPSAAVEPLEDPHATQALDPVALQQQLEKELPPENRRPEAMRLYRNLIEPHYTQDEVEFLGDNDDEAADVLGQLIGWFHPAFKDRRGRSMFDNPGRLGIKVAQEFEAEGLDVVRDADEFMRRVEKYVVDETKAEVALAIAHRDAQPRHPDYDRPPAAHQIPGTPEHDEFRQLMQMAADKADRGSGYTHGRATAGRLRGRKK